MKLTFNKKLLSIVTASAMVLLGGNIATALNCPAAKEVNTAFNNPSEMYSISYTNRAEQEVSRGIMWTDQSHSGGYFFSFEPVNGEFYSNTVSDLAKLHAPQLDSIGQYCLYLGSPIETAARPAHVIIYMDASNATQATAKTGFKNLKINRQ